MRGRVRPSRPASAVSFIAGIVAVFFGLFVIIPSAGAFGVIWVIVAIAGLLYSGTNLFTDDGVAHEVVDFESSEMPEGPSAESRLEELERLRGKGLVSDEEYTRTRQRILSDL